MSMVRGNGVLAHISSLPSAFGIGDLGPNAYKFVDFLCAAKQRYWQILPLTPTEIKYGNSPYSSPSAFAGNPLLISPELLVRDNLINESDLRIKSGFPDQKIEFSKISVFKDKLFKKAYQSFLRNSVLVEEFAEFCREHEYWIEDYALFAFLKGLHKNKYWNAWPKKIRERDPRVLENIRKDNVLRINEVKFRQFIFYRQWNRLKNYCHEKNIEIIGDIPIYVNFDSADVWANQSIFKLNEKLRAKFVAGVPPDYFSKTGQRWGNPVYNWKVLQKNKFLWWVKRVQHNLRMYDCVRIDHFRGFAAYWQIPAKERTAIRGRWVTVPGLALFSKVKEMCPDANIIAEDIGYITPDVRELMNAMMFPGMKILQFAFEENGYCNDYLPENYESNSVAYTGTHDNNTVRGWYQKEVSKEKREMIRKFLGDTFNKDQLHWLFIERVMKSRADVTIIPLQDILGLGEEGKMNRPGRAKGNWAWRFSLKDLTPALTKKLLDLTLESERI